MSERFHCNNEKKTCWQHTFVFRDDNRNGILDLSDSVDLIHETGTKGGDGDVHDLSLSWVKTNTVRQFLSSSGGFYSGFSPLVRLTRFLGPMIPSKIRLGGIWDYLGREQKKWEEAGSEIPIRD
ncbi:MAG: hypothetical protein ABH871_03355 [Pseudomonadota bacterium]